MSIFDTIKESDLQILDKKINEEGVWNAGEVVTFLVTDVTEIKPDPNDAKKQGGIFLRTKALDSEHEGAKKSFYLKNNRADMPEVALQNHMRLMSEVFGREKLANKSAKVTDAIGVKIKAKAGKAKTVQDRTYQEFYDYVNVGKTDVVQDAVDTADFSNAPL